MIVTQSCVRLFATMDCSLPDFSLHGILQARILEWVAISFSRDLPDPGIEPGSPALQADALPSEPIVACGAVPELRHVGSVVMVHGLSYYNNFVNLQMRKFTQCYN